MPQMVERAMLMVHEKDPKQEIWDEVNKYLPDVTINGTDLLIAVYVRPEKTASGLILTRTTQKEDNYQGIVGLVVAIGPCVGDDETVQRIFAGKAPKLNDWVVFNGGDTWQFKLGDRTMRLLPANYVRLVVARPDIVI